MQEVGLVCLYGIHRLGQQIFITTKIPIFSCIWAVTPQKVNGEKSTNGVIDRRDKKRKNCYELLLWIWFIERVEWLTVNTIKEKSQYKKQIIRQVWCKEITGTDEIR